MCLNAMAIDPERVWKGVWRWYSEELLDCCAPLDVVRKQGITIDQFCCLARCNGVERTVPVRPPALDKPNVADDRPESLRAFRDAIVTCVKQDQYTMVVSYSRKGLQQTGDGHFSPIGGYDDVTDSCLILDVARFKYPPHWVKVDVLYNALRYCDSVTKQPRGWIILRPDRSVPNASTLFVPGMKMRKVVALIREQQRRRDDSSTNDIHRRLLTLVSDSTILEHDLRVCGSDCCMIDSHARSIAHVIREVEETPVYVFLCRNGGHGKVVAQNDDASTKDSSCCASSSPVHVTAVHVVSLLILAMPKTIFDAPVRAVVGGEDALADKKHLLREVRVLRCRISALLDNVSGVE